MKKSITGFVISIYFFTLIFYGCSLVNIIPSSSSNGKDSNKDVNKNYSYVISFNSEGGTEVAPETVYSPNSNVDTLSQSTNPGYNFCGWYTAPGGGGEPFLTDTVVTSSMTVYAYWYGASLSSFNTNSDNTITLNGFGTNGSIVIPETINGYPVTCIGGGALAFSGINSITIPESVTNIGDYSFANENITSLTIPPSIIRMGTGDFSDCYNMNTLIMTGVTNIWPEEFEFNLYLTNFNIPSSVKGIEDEGFLQCVSLSYVTIPVSVQNIGESAFQNCGNLTNVTFAGANCSITDSTVFSGDSSLTIHAPSGGSVQAYCASNSIPFAAD